MNTKSFFKPEKAVKGHFVAKVDAVADSSLLYSRFSILSYFVTEGLAS